jgi:hypothetical protein
MQGILACKPFGFRHGHGYRAHSPWFQPEIKSCKQEYQNVGSKKINELCLQVPLTLLAALVQLAEPLLHRQHRLHRVFRR